MMSYREKILNSFKKHGEIIPVIKLNDIPKSDYIYTVINKDNVLQIGKSSPNGKGRLKKVFKGSIVSKHNKAFICGLYPSIANSDNEYFAISLSDEQDKSKVEIEIHHDMGITTNVHAATLIEGITNVGIHKFHHLLWEKFKEQSLYRQMDKIEKLMALELYELVTFGTSRITRKSGNIISSKQADNLEGNILMCLNKLYLTNIWLMMCKNYFRYGKHSISNDDFQAVKENYKYQERGYSFDVIGKS